MEKEATLQQSKWGRVISLKEIGIALPNGRDMAFLHYGGNCRDFTVGKTYRVQILFRTVYQSITKRKDGTKEIKWAEIQAATYEGVKTHPEFPRMGLSEDKIVPYFTILS